ncbi:hypothetical protein ACJIZ3_000813 [Penstemon smallii]|uniref:GATA transcription factor n=1 Tax=Penstemon smallii TaxID=265156 RepID=A0ABD3U2A2_9LAMI
MECVEARALKSSFLSQMSMQTSSHNDDVWCLTGTNNVPSDDFSIEDLLNLDFPEIEFQEESLFEQKDEEKVSQNINSNHSSSNFEFHSFSSVEFAVPLDDMENLEWLSQFVDDSTSGISLMCADGSFEKTEEISVDRVDSVSRRVSFLPFRVPGKARSKRSRSNGRSWSLASPPLSAAESSPMSSSSHSSSVLSPLVFTNRIQDADWFSNAEKPAAKKLRRNPEAETGSVSGRRCTHCLVQKTPQWRTGPLGPKTLCNACGVRFKSGRLFPEYRPACSPTYLQKVHSNSHRKVLEMRRKKEVQPWLTRAVQSF